MGFKSSLKRKPLDLCVKTLNTVLVSFSGFITTPKYGLFTVKVSQVKL